MILRRQQIAGPDRLSASTGDIARRRSVIVAVKAILPVCATALLAAIALWPDFNRGHDNARFSFSNVSGELEGARLKNAKYHGLDERGRPYTLTTDVARQLDADRVELTRPQGDMVLENGTWMNLKADKGIFVQKSNNLDLTGNVTLYRDDGTTLTTPNANIDIKTGIAAGSDPVHIEGPFGRIDAQGFTAADKGATLNFSGPARAILNGGQK